MNVLAEAARSEASCPPWCAVCLSEVWPGLGTAWAGRLVFGLFLLAAFLACSVLGMLLLYLPDGSIVLSFLFFALAVVLWVYGMFHAHRSARTRISSEQEVSPGGPNAWLGVFLTLIVPGLGHFYIKSRLRAIVVFIVWVGLFILDHAVASEFRIAPPLFVPVFALYSLAVCWDVYRLTTDAAQRNLRALKALFGFVFLQAILLEVPSAVITRVIVDSYSMATRPMAPALPTGSRVLSFMSDSPQVKRGDIIIFIRPIPPGLKNRLPPEQLRERKKRRYCFRAVGLEGEELEIRDGKLLIDGEAWTPPQAIRYLNLGVFEQEGASLTVPRDHVYVLGDNSAHSADSRFFGPVPKTNILGKAYKIIWPLDLAGPVR